MTPQEQERIKADAYALGRHDGYVAGATAEQQREHLLVKTLKQVEYHLLLAKNKPNSTDYKGLVEHLSKAVTNTIEQWKGEEVGDG